MHDQRTRVHCVLVSMQLGIDGGSKSPNSISSNIETCLLDSYLTGKIFGKLVFEKYGLRRQHQHFCGWRWISRCISRSNARYQDLLDSLSNYKFAGSALLKPEMRVSMFGKDEGYRTQCNVN